MSKIGIFALLGMGLLATACAAGDQLEGTTAEEAHEPIIGGTDTTGDPAIVGLLAFKPGETSASLCTSTLITPTVLLTAAHCVDPAVVGEGMSFEARFAPNIRMTPDDMKIPVKEVHWNEAFDPNNLTGGNDVAVAILSRPAPGNIKPIPYMKTAIPDSAVGGTMRVVGFGLSNGFDMNGETAGIKREAQITFVSKTDLLLNVGATGLTICNGDSGGPGLIKVNGVETVAGINSYGFIFCLGAAYQTNVATYKDFIAKYADGTSCTPACSNKACGSDGCGGDCGKCGPNDMCGPANQCIPEQAGGCPIEHEGNNDANQANTFCDGNYILGSISSDLDDDWYSFDIKPGTTYTVLLDNVDAKYTMALYKRSAKTGNLMTVGDAPLAGGNRVISRRTSDGGLYYLKVNGKGVKATDQYGVYLVLP